MVRFDKVRSLENCSDDELNEYIYDVIIDDAYLYIHKFIY